MCGKALQLITFSNEVLEDLVHAMFSKLSSADNSVSKLDQWIYRLSYRQTICARPKMAVMPRICPYYLVLASLRL